MSEKPSTASSRRTCSTVISARSAPAARISSTRVAWPRSGIQLAGANLRLASLFGTNLTQADLSGADLACAKLSGANLAGAKLTKTGAILTAFVRRSLSLKKPRGTSFDPIPAVMNLRDAVESDVRNLTQTQLDEACGADTKLLEGLKLKACSTDR